MKKSKKNLFPKNISDPPTVREPINLLFETSEVNSSNDATPIEMPSYLIRKETTKDISSKYDNTSQGEQTLQTQNTAEMF